MSAMRCLGQVVLALLPRASNGRPQWSLMSVPCESQMPNTASATGHPQPEAWCLAQHLLKVQGSIDQIEHVADGLHAELLHGLAQQASERNLHQGTAWYYWPEQRQPELNARPLSHRTCLRVIAPSRSSKLHGVIRARIPKEERAGLGQQCSCDESSAQDLCCDQPGQLCAGSCREARLAGVACTNCLLEWQQLSSSDQVSLEA